MVPTIINMRRRMARRRPMGTVIQSFKKVINHAPASRAAGTKISFGAVAGVDSVAAGQTTATDQNVPTGSVIKYIEFQLGITNLVSVSMFAHIAIEHIRSGQATVIPNAVGGDPIRNQVHHQAMFTVGKDQNSNHVYRFKVPKKYQRVREGDSWQFVTTVDQIHTSALQIIYKFYR